MEDKASGRRPSGSGEIKPKGKSNKKKRKNKTKERERKRAVVGKATPEQETNSDSAVDFGKRKPKGPQSHSSEKNRTKLSDKSSLSSLQTSKGTQSAPVIGTRSLSSGSGISLLDKKGLMDIYAMFPSESEPNKLTVSMSQSSSADSEIGEVTEMVDESMRWENAQSDQEAEDERIRVYKMNRRKRYLIDAYQKRDDKEGVLKLAKEIARCKDDTR